MIAFQPTTGLDGMGCTCTYNTVYMCFILYMTLCAQFFFIWEVQGIYVQSCIGCLLVTGVHH